MRIYIMDLQNATDVRKNWSITLDKVSHERPAYVKRTHDNVHSEFDVVGLSFLRRKV